MKPYTYYIQWTKLSKRYYGVKFGKDADSSTLWVDYFTSSSHVKELREAYGEPDIIEVRRTFDDAKSAIDWESKVLKRMQVIYKEEWLNKTDNRSILMDKETREKISKSKKGKTVRKGFTLSEEHKRKIGEANKKHKGRKMSEETRRKISESMKGKNKRPKSNDHKRKLSESQKGKTRSGRPRKV